MTQLDAEIRSRLHDVAERCARIAEYIGTATFAEFDGKTRAAVEREMITIGEAIRASLQIMPAFEELVPDAREIVDLRNVLVHGYRSLAPAIIWTLATAEVPLLERRVRELLAGPSPA